MALSFASGCTQPTPTNGEKLPPDLKIPPGFTVLASRSFNAAQEGNWETRQGRLFRIVEDPSAAISGPCVAEALYPRGFPSGSGPINTFLNLRDDYSRIYVAFWIKFSLGWIGQEAGVNKILFLWTHEDPAVFLTAQGADKGPLALEVRLQDVPGGARNLLPSPRMSGLIPRGRWVRCEILLVLNRGTKPGSATWWVNGQRAGNYEDVHYGGPMQPANWQRVSWNPTYGGRGRPVPAPQYMMFDHIIVAVAK